MKLFRVILVTLALTCVNGDKLFKEGMITGEAWLHYTRSGLLNKVLSRRIPEQHVVSLQRIQNNKVQQLREALAELLKGKAHQKSKRVRRRKPKQNSQNKRKNRFNRFKNFHN